MPSTTTFRLSQAGTWLATLLVALVIAIAVVSDCLNEAARDSAFLRAFWLRLGVADPARVDAFEVLGILFLTLVGLTLVFKGLSTRRPIAVRIGSLCGLVFCPFFIVKVLLMAPLLLSFTSSFKGQCQAELEY